MGRGGTLVETMTVNRKVEVVGSTPALDATQGPWASPLPAVNNNNNNNFRVSNIRVSSRTLIYNVCSEAALT